MSVRVYPAKLRRILDGDSYVLDIDHGMYVWSTQRIRLRGVNCPEITGDSKAAGYAAKEYVEDVLAEHPLTVTSYKDERSFERWVADVATPHTDVAAALLAAGHATAWTD